MNALRGWLAALGSVLLASAAQLGMRWGMSRLPLPEAWAGQTPERAALLAVALAVAAYAASHCCAGWPPCATCRWAAPTAC